MSLCCWWWWWQWYTRLLQNPFMLHFKSHLIFVQTSWTLFIKMRLKSEHCTLLFTHILCASYLLMLRRSMGKCGMRHGKNYNAVYITRKIAKSHKQYAMEEQLASKALFSPFRWYVFRIYCIKTPFVKNIIKINYFLFMYF